MERFIREFVIPFVDGDFHSPKTIPRPVLAVA